MDFPFLLPRPRVCVVLIESAINFPLLLVRTHCFLVDCFGVSVVYLENNFALVQCH